MFFFFQAEDGIRDFCLSRGLGDVYKRQAQYPDIQFHIHSGNAPDVIEKLDNGLIDFALLTPNSKINDYNHMLLPLSHHWGVLMLKDDPLAQKESITFEDLRDKPLIVSKELQQISDLVEWLHNDIEHLHIISSYTLLYNASLMVEAVSYTHLRAHETGRNLVCRLLLEKKKNKQQKKQNKAKQKKPKRS